MTRSESKINDGLDKLNKKPVRVHSNSRPSPIGAIGFFAGKDIHVGPKSEQHPAHELSHTIQQGSNERLKPKLK